jgi:hypothetical protein
MQPHLKREDFRMNHHRALALCLRMISAPTLHLHRAGKPLHTFPDHALDESGPRGQLTFRLMVGIYRLSVGL